MYVSKLATISSILVVLILSSNICLADVEDILDAQADILKSEEEKKKEDKRALNLSKNGIELGRQEYKKTCAICHGDDAKGNGPFSVKLYKKPEDLTLMKMKNNGVFPFKRLYKIIDGRDSSSLHGSRTMPVWGDRYSAESWFEVSTHHSETLAIGKIFELLLYLESIQQN